MENNKYNSNNSSRCRKFRQALANSPAGRAISRMSHYHHQESSRPSSDSPLPQHVKGNNFSNEEAHGPIPIKFDYSQPPQYANASSLNPNRHEDKGKKLKAQEFDDYQQYEKKDANYIFSEYIKRAREKLRTVSNIGKGQSKPSSDEAYYNYGNNFHEMKKKDDHRDQISDFIHLAKKKIRTTSSVGKTSSLKRG